MISTDCGIVGLKDSGLPHLLCLLESLIILFSVNFIGIQNTFRVPYMPDTGKNIYHIHQMC